MNALLRCRCGRVQGHADLAQAASRCICYCKNCQAYASFLGNEQNIVNSRGGTEIIATIPCSVQLDRGIEELVCVALTAKGPLRWYAKCCRTPIGNTSRDPKLAYLGLLRACLVGPDRSFDDALGPMRVALNTESARGQVKATPVATFFAMLKIAKMIVGARLRGTNRINLFFQPGSGAPIQTPELMALG